MGRERAYRRAETCYNDLKRVTVATALHTLGLLNCGV